MPKKILLVDDEIELLSVLKRSLTRQGYSVHTASSVDEAWDAIIVTMYDLIISDLAMGNESGIDLLKQVRTIDTLMPFIIMTGAGSIDTAVVAMQHGA